MTDSYRFSSTSAGLVSRTAGAVAGGKSDTNSATGWAAKAKPPAKLHRQAPSYSVGRHARGSGPLARRGSIR